MAVLLGSVSGTLARVDPPEVSISVTNPVVPIPVNPLDGRFQASQTEKTSPADVTAIVKQLYRKLIHEADITVLASACRQYCAARLLNLVCTTGAGA